MISLAVSKHIIESRGNTLLRRLLKEILFHAKLLRAWRHGRIDITFQKYYITDNGQYISRRPKIDKYYY